MQENFIKELYEHLKKYEGYTVHFVLNVVEGFNVAGKVTNMKLGNCEDEDIAFENGITLHTYKTVHQFNFSDKDIISLKCRKAYDETDNDTITINYKSGTYLTLWFE